MSTRPQEASGTTEGAAQSRGIETRHKIVAAVAALLVVAGFSAAIYGLATNPPVAATVRDIMIILLALSTVLIGLSLVVLVLQLQSLIGLLRDEIRPILDSANSTARTVRGTATFLSDSVVHPVISVASYASGIRQALRLLLMGRRR